MAQQADITVYDGAATPVAHTLKALDNKVMKDGTRLATWREALASLPANAQVRAELRQRELPSGVTETRFRVVTPVMETVGSQNASGYTAAPKVAYEDYDEWVKFAHPRSTSTSRKLNSQMLRNVMNNVSTTVTPIAAGVLDDAFIQQFLPT